MEQGFSILEHPSDLGIAAHGASLAEAFESAARGLISIILEPATVSACEEREVRIEAGDREQLLVRWLSELLYLYDGKKFVGSEFRISQLSDTLLIATVRGEPFSPLKHATRLDVKAVTYHQLAVEETSGGASVQVFLDI